jgi:hypothetical protein
MPSVTVHTRQSAEPDLTPRGYVHVEGPYMREHRRTIEALLRNEARRARDASPSAEILSLDDDGAAGLLVTTSTEHLAHRLGRRLHKAFGGVLHHGFHHQNKLAFVWWWR